MSTSEILTCFYGSAINFADLDESKINILDIAHRLSNINRFNGGTLTPYSVGKHCITVFKEAHNQQPNNIKLQLYALLHDATEAFMGDMVSPLKVSQDKFSNLENKLLHVIYEKLGIESLLPSEQDKSVVNSIDKDMCYAEWYKLNGDYLCDHAGAWRDIYGDKKPDVKLVDIINDQISSSNDFIRQSYIFIFNTLILEARTVGYAL